MTRPAKLAGWLGLWCMLPALTALPVLPAMAAERQMEEVVVTGSYIRRKDSFDTPSPITVLDAIDIEQEGVTSMGQVFKRMTENNGTDWQTNVYAATGQGGNSSAANLRGLGERSTLTLLDGRRTPSDNINNLYPQIGIERIEVIKDGSSALYGSDAVAGVVNLIPRKNYEGLEFNVSAMGADGYNEVRWGMLGGVQGDRTRAVVAFEYRNQGELRMVETSRLKPQFSYSTEANPGSYNVPVRDVTGAITTQAVRPDPECGVNNTNADAGINATDKTQFGGFISGGRQIRGVTLGARTGGNCTFDFGQFWNFLDPSEEAKALFLFEHDITDYVTFSAEILATRQDVASRGSPSNPGGRTADVIVPGENPGNPFPAYFDRNDDDVVDVTNDPATNEQFFVLEDPNNPGFYLRDANGDTTFANSANPFDPTVAGSLPLYEDVRMSSYRLVGMTAKALALRIPGIEGPDAINNHGSNNSAAQFEGYNYRYGGKLDIEIPDTTWHASLSYVWHEARAFQDFKNESLSATITGVNGELPITDDLGVVSPEWFNPFSTQVFTCPSWTVNASGELVCAEGLVQTDPDQLNSATVWDRISFRQQAKNIWRNNLVDVVFSGDLYDLPFSWNDGTVGLAIGGQYNKVKREFNGGPLMNSDDLWIGIKADDWNKNRDERAIFGEIIVPLWNTEMLGVAEIQAAGRYTDVEDIETSWDPKVAGRWEPRPWLAIRGSWGTSFIAPSMDDLFEPQVLGLSQYADPIRGDGEAFRPRAIGGTPGLQPEESKNFNVGATFLLLDDALSVSVDYSEFHFDNRIVRPLPDDIFDLEQIRYGQLAAANSIALNVDGDGLPIPTDPVNAGDIPANNTLLFQWVTNLKDAGTGEDPRIVRSTPTPLEIANELVPQLRFVDAALVNAQTQDVKVYDFNVKYRFDSQQIPWFDADFGSFELGLSGTYMKEYSWVQGGVDQRSQSGEGKQNNSTSFAPPTPEWRLRQKTSWLYGRHSVSMITQFISEVEQDDGICAAFTPFFPTFCEDEFERWFEVDLQYNLTLDNLIGDRTTRVILGANNLFNKTPEKMATRGSTETFLYDVRGRQLYLRVSQDI